MRKLLLFVLLTMAFSGVYSQSCDAPKANGVTICAGSTTTLTASGGGGEYRWYNSLSDGTLLATGGEFVTPVLSTTTTYFVEVVNNDCISPRTAVTVTVGVKPTAAGANICAGTSVTLNAGGTGGVYQWFDAATEGNLLHEGSSFKTPELLTSTTYFVQTTVDGCTSSRTAVAVTVNARQDPPDVPDRSICAGSTTILTASGSSGGIYQWFDVPEGGQPLIISPDYTTPALNTTTVFYVQSVLNGCTSLRKAVTITVNPIPAVPAVSGITICSGSVTTLKASGGDSYNWYAVPSRGNPIATGANFTTPALNRTTTYYVETVSNGCASPRTAVTVNVTPVPEPPKVSGQTGCLGTALTLVAPSVDGVTYSWFDAAEGGTLLAQTTTFTTPILNANTTYFVQSENSGCVSTRTAVNVNLVSAPKAPVIADITTCSGNTIVLTPDSVEGSVEWYDAPVGGNLLLTAPQFTTPVLTANTTYYVQNSLNGCPSERVPVKITVKAAPPTPVVADLTICPGNTTVLAVAPSTSSTQAGNVEYHWFDAAGNLLGIAPTYTTPALNADITYYVQAVLDGCTSARIPVTVKIATPPGRLFRYPSGTYCKDSRDPVPIKFTTLTGTFSAMPAGVVFKNTATGEIDLNASAVGDYIVTFKANAPCSPSTFVELRITRTTNAEFKLEGPYCQGETNPFLTYPTGGSGGVISVSTSGLFFASDGSIDLQRTRPGTYIITNTIPSNGGSCVSTSASDTVVILPSVLVNAGIDQVIIPGSNVNLTGTVGYSSNHSWSGGKGTFSDVTSLKPTYTPAPDESNIRLFLTAKGVAPCLTEKIDTIDIAVLFPPITADQTICYGSTATISLNSESNYTYEWYDSASGGTPMLSNPSFISPALTRNTTYYVRSTLGGLASPRMAVRITVLPRIDAPKANGTAICAGGTASLNATGSGGTFRWYDDAAGGNILSTEAVFITPALTSTTTYYVQQVSGNCASSMTPVTVTVAPKPVVTSAALFTICDSTSLNYQITASLPGTSFSWSRAAVPGIINEASTGQTSPIIRETLNSTLTSPVEVTYVITPSLNGCIGDPFNFVVTVDPSPNVLSASFGQICNNSASNYTIEYNMAGTNFNWSRAAVPGISNRAIGGQMSHTIREVLTNTTNAPVDVTYIFHQSYAGCAGTPFKYVVTVNPSPQITSKSAEVICNKSPLNYTITSNIKGATFTWSRAAVAGISNEAADGVEKSDISETLINTTRSAITVTYRITAVFNGCQAPIFNYRVTVNPTAAPVIKASTKVCEGDRITLSTTQIAGATYSWKGPNGFRSNHLNPLINRATEANDGRYSLVITINGCVSDTAYADIEIVDPPTANAGANQTLCISTSGVVLKGIIGGGASAGAWTSSGSGVFSPSNTDVNATYVPSQNDKNAGFVKLSLTATSTCASAVSSVDITFVPIPVVDAGADKEVCSQSPNVTLNGKISIPQNVIWASSGTGTFQPSNTSLNAIYVPSSKDINKGSVVLTLTSAGLSVCLPVMDEINIKIVPPPSVNTGADILLPLGRTITLNPNVNYKDVKYLWTPGTNLSDNTIKNPVLTGVADQVYKLTVTDSRGCVTEDEIFVDVLMPIVTYNTFSPNGDGINDLWNIPELTTYPNNTVTVFNRYGDKIFSSVGYKNPWDGTHNGSPAPVGTYYYVIDTKFPGLVHSGYVTILK
ncbi:Ig-like domain-containing protein [Daejeonella lutea]|uniref:Gliding motility-associated C-terminal domain-containing protein n=1 Tax=Daejeonella lutea TaxID=572036 RepID=A0A1T5EG45_9SPHI|nr:PKD-like domain-containing protein [Daejeonella lutea]SKB82962.1 gliding motility-associated C-terminal domain-containing protein [Daejeonella lutea]